MSGNPEAKAQHYVPQMYLRRFASKHRGRENGKVDYFIHWFDKTEKEGRNHEQNIRKVAHETRFNNATLPDGNTFSLETELSSLENEFSPVLDAICARSKPFAEILAAYRVKLSLFVAVQALRTPNVRAFVNECVLVNTRNNEDHMADALPIPRDVKVLAHLAGFTDALPKFASVIMQWRWSLAHNMTDTPLCTSDQPVLFDTLPEMGPPGMLKPGTVIYMPINPWLLLRVADPDFNLEPEEKIFDPDLVLRLNRNQVWESRRFLYSSTKDFAFAQQMIADIPALSISDRPYLDAAGRRTFTRRPSTAPTRRTVIRLDDSPGEDEPPVIFWLQDM